MTNKKMRKGLGIGTVIGLFLVIAVIVFMYIVFNYGPGLLEQLANIAKGIIFGEGNGEENGEPEELLEAIECAFYRCIEGCDYVKGRAWDTIQCDCEENWDENDDGKICEESKDHPVSVLVAEGVWVTKEWMKEVFPEEIWVDFYAYKIECLLPYDNCDPDWFALKIQGCSECETELCWMADQTYRDACKKCKVRPGSYHVYVDDKSGFWHPVVCKSYEYCEVSDKPLVASPSVVAPGESTTVSVWSIVCNGRKASVYLERDGSSTKCGEEIVSDAVFSISCSIPDDWPEGLSKVWIWVDEDGDDQEEAEEYTTKIDITISSVIEECFYGTLECGNECRDYLGHGDYLIGCYKYGCPPGWTSLGDYGCSASNPECTHCCCKDLSGTTTTTSPTLVVP